MKRYEYIDKLKFLGAISIFLYHTTGMFGIPAVGGSIAKAFNIYGWIFVEMFFWFSGYLMQQIYSMKIRNKDITLNMYLKKRIIKLYPMYAISTVLCWFIKSMVEYEDVSLWDFIVNLYMVNTGYHNFNGEWRNAIGNVTWYIGVLIFCYFMFYFINKWVQDSENLVFIYVIGCMLSSYGLGWWNMPILNFYMLRGIIGFFAGSLFALLFRNEKLSGKKRFYVVIGSAIILLWFIGTLLKQNMGNSKLITLFDVAIMPSVMLLIENVYWIKKILNTSSLLTSNLGKLSTFIFYMHWPISYIVAYILNINNVRTDRWLIYLLVYILIIGLGIIYIFLEKTMLKQIKKQVHR